MTTWLTTTWQWCPKAKIQILGNQTTIPLPRHRDTEIMCIFIKVGYQKISRAILNKCRMYMQVTYLSDLCTAAGNALECHLWLKPSTKNSPYNWLMVPKPIPGEWQFQQRTLQTTLSLGNQLMLALPLGKWCQASSLAAGWYYTPTKTALYQKSTTGWKRHGIFPQ